MDTRSYGNSLGIYLTTFCIETITGAFRALIFTLLLLPFGFLLGFLYLLFWGRLVRPGLFGATPDFEAFIIIMFAVVGLSMLMGGLLAFLPLGFSVLSYWGAGGGYAFTRFALGARPPSTREWERLQEELDDIRQALDREVLSFSRILVIDAPLERIYTIGTTLYISSEAVRNSRHLGALLAHELGHLNHADSGMVLSLRRLVFPLFYLIVGHVTNYSTGRSGANSTRQSGQTPSDVYYSMLNALIFFVLATVGGGLGVWICSFWWADYFRKRDFLADRFVVECGLEDQLIDYLEQNMFYDTSVPYMQGWQPANELRLDRLLNPNTQLPQNTAQLLESPFQRYAGVLILAFVAALAFNFFVPLGFLWIFVIFLAIGLYLRGNVRDLRALADWLFQGRTRTQAYFRMFFPAFAVVVLLNLLVRLPTWGYFWFIFILVAGSLYCLRWAAFGTNDLGAVLGAAYGHLNHHYRRLTSGQSVAQPAGGSARQTHFQRRILEIAAQQGADAVLLPDIRNVLIEITTRFSGVTLVVVRGEIQRLVDCEYITLRDDVLQDLADLLADSTLADPQDVIQWLDQRMPQP